MRKYLLVGITVVAVAFAANQVMTDAAPNPEDGTISGNSAIRDQVQQLRDNVSRIVWRHEREPAPATKEAALLIALDAYLDEDKLGKIIDQLDTFVKQSPASPRAAKAAAAISILKGEDLGNEFNRRPTRDESIVRPRTDSERVLREKPHLIEPQSEDPN